MDLVWSFALLSSIDEKKKLALTRFTIKDNSPNFDIERCRSHIMSSPLRVPVRIL